LGCKIFGKYYFSIYGFEVQTLFADEYKLGRKS